MIATLMSHKPLASTGEEVSVDAETSPQSSDWFIQTSATIGLQAPLTSFTKKDLASAAFSLGQALCDGSRDGYAWVDFCRWAPDPKYGMQMQVDERYQLAFTRFGVVVMKDWEQMFVPDSRLQSDRPVLVYDYDSFCFLFCDATHFVPKTQAWSLFADVFGITAPPIAESPPEGSFADIHNYMNTHNCGLGTDGEPIRPRFYNRDDE